MDDCSLCAQFGELYGFQPILIDPTMYKFTADSSSDDEAGSVQHLVPVSSSSTPIIDVSNTTGEKKGATTGGSDDGDEIKEMLDKVLEAVRQTPPDSSKKGVSIYRIKEYLRQQHQVKKPQMTRQLKPAMEAALHRKLLIKVTGTRGVLLGSVKLNPAHEDPANDSESSTEDEAPAVVPETAREAKKRKAGGEESAKTSKVSKRLKV